MENRHLISLARRFHRLSKTLGTFSTATNPNPQLKHKHKHKHKHKRLQNPDPRFVRYNSPAPTRTDHEAILSAPLTKVSILPNGLRVATESNMSSKTATLGVWIDAGPRYESFKTNGTAHFLEHMLFKGTQKRTAGCIAQEIENVGGHLNAYTSREITSYYVNVMDTDVPIAMDILSDILENSKLDEGTIEEHRGMILREMAELEGQMEEVIFDRLHAAAFLGSPLAKTITGPVDNVKIIGKPDIQNYLSTHYTARRMVIAASGAVKHRELVKQVESLFTKLAVNATRTSDLAAKEPAVFTCSEVRIIDNDVPLAHFAVAFEGASWTDPDSIALMVIQAMLGSWQNSTGFGKHMGWAGLDCLDELAYSIMSEVTRLCHQVLEEDVLRACNQVKSSLLFHTDRTSTVAEDIGHELLIYGRRIPYAEMFARIDAVDASTVQRVARRFIYEKDIAIAALGTIQSLPDYKTFRSKTVWDSY